MSYTTLRDQRTLHPPLETGILHASGHPSTTVGAMASTNVSRDCALDLCADRLVGVVGLAVGEEVVDNHANDREEEDDEGPDDLAGNRAV